MANSLADLNIRLGFLFDQRSLARVERDLQRTAAKLSRVGSDMSLAISAPLGLIGVSAIKAAGDIESFENALKSQLGSAAAAKTELEALRKEALKPGLGFEQAVKGSVSLQAVGLSADQARKTLSEFGNALAFAGKGKAELDGVALAITQISAKGKVSAEEINQIAERLPQIRTLMKQAFGTADTEALQKLGITSEQFISGIVKQMEGLPRATGGIKNSIENAGDAVSQFLGSIGNEINKAFNITSLSEELSDTLKSVSNSFAALDDSTKRMAVQFGLAVVAAGPLLKVFGAFYGAAGQLVGIWSKIAGVISTAWSGLSTAVISSFGIVDNSIKGFEAAFGRLKVALGVVGLVAGLATAFYTLADNFDAAKFGADKFAESQKAIISQTASEIGLLNQSFDVLKDETKGRFEKGKVIDQLLKQYPEYLKGIDLEKASITELNTIQRSLNDSILRGVAERQKAAAITSIYEKQAETLLRIQQLKDGASITASEATLIDTGDMIAAGGRAEAVMIKLKQRAEALGSQVGVVASQFDSAFGTINRAIDPTIEAEYKLRDAYYAEKESVGENTAATNTATVSAKALAAAKREKKDATAAAKAADDEETASMERYAKMVREIEQAWLDEANAEAAARALSVGAVDTSTGAPGGELQLKDPGQAITDLPTKITPAVEAMNALNSSFFSFNEVFASVAENIGTNGSILANIALAMGSSMQEAASKGVNSFAELGNAAKEAASKIIRAYIQEGVAAAVAKALGGVPFPFNIAAGAAAGALAPALFSKALGAIGIQGFAKGTSSAPGGLSLVGEKGPELLNIPKYSQVYTANQTSKMLSGMDGGGGVTLDGEFTVRGTDLVLVFERAQQKNARFR